MAVNSRPRPRPGLDAQARLSAEADIRQAIGQRAGIQFSADRELIEEAALILVAISRLRTRWCIGREWHRRLGQHMYRDRAWRAFDLLQSLGFVYCDNFDDPCDDGLVEVGDMVIGKY